MPRVVRLVVAGLLHHITQPGNRRERASFEDDDYGLYIDLMVRACRRAYAKVKAHCLANHVHVILPPSNEDGCAEPLPICSALYRVYQCPRIGLSHAPAAIAFP